MRKNSKARVAVFAAAALVGGLVPILGVASASAAEPTALSVSPSSSIVARTGGPVDYTVTLNSGTAANGVYYYVASGPDTRVPTPLAGTPCTATTPPAAAGYTCTVTHGIDAGVDNLRFFSDAANTGSFQTGDVFTTATLTVAGPVNRVALTPAVGHAAALGYQKYTVSAFDSANTPVPGAVVRVAGVDPAVSPGVVSVKATDPGTVAFDGTTSSTPTDVTTTTFAAATTDNPVGTAPVWVASSKAGTVNVTVNGTAGDTGGATNALISAAGTLVVSAGGDNAVTNVTVTPTPQNDFINTTVTETITLTNASGDPVSGVTPVVAVITGPNAGEAVSVVGPTNGLGQTTAAYPAGATVGTDTVRAFVNQSTPGNTGGLDPSEPRGTGVVNLATDIVTDITGVDNDAPVDVSNVPLTFTVTTSVASAAGVNVTFTLPPGTPAKYSVNPSGTTDANGKVIATVTNSSPLATDSVVVTAKAGASTADATASWRARVYDHIVIAPAADTKPVGGTTTHTVTTVDQYGAPISGLTYLWVVTGRNNDTNNPGATGTGSSFTYTDTGVTTGGGTDTVTVTALNAAGTVTYGADSVSQYWVLGNAVATQANIDINDFDGYYDNTGVNGPYVPTDFVKSDTNIGVTGNPVAPDTADVQTVAVRLIDANGDSLYGKSVSFTSTGVGVFTDADGTPIGASTTALVSDGSFGEEQDFATVYVRSTTAGTQTITATVDGITDSGTITYTDQYVALAPQRVADSRTGQGDIASWNSSNPPQGGRLAPNTLYYFDYYSVDMPQNADAYAFNVTAIDPNGVGNLRVESNCNDNQDWGRVPSTSLINYQSGKDVANFVIVPRGCGGLKIYSANSSVAVAIDLVGYYPDGDSINNITATRVVDTRTGLGGGTGRLNGYTSRSFQITGNAGIPAGATAVALNVTAVNPSGVGNLRIYPNGSATPLASSINYIPGVDKSAFVIVKLPANGKIDVYSAGGTVDVAVDAFAYYDASSTMVTAAPTRILDTRNGGTLAADTAKPFQVTGMAGVPADAQAVLVSVTSIHNANSTGVGNLRIYPTGGEVPFVSTLNYVSSTTDVANFAIVKLGTGGKLSLFSAGSPIDVAVDVVGYIPAGAGSPSGSPSPGIG